MAKKLPFKVYKVNKKIAETPLEALTKFVNQKKLPNEWKFTYAGRLDPMAHGLLLVLANSTQVNKEKYLNLSKVYEAEILFGFDSDTGDLLGIATLDKNTETNKKPQKEFTKVLQSFVPKANLPIPVFSSVLVRGKPGFHWARLGEKTPQVKRFMEFKSIEILKKTFLTNRQILKYLEKNITKVKGDFRQKEILAHWKKLLKQPKEKHMVFKIRVNCGSGAYIRSLASEWGKMLGLKSLLFSLKRNQVGKYRIV